SWDGSAGSANGYQVACGVSPSLGGAFMVAGGAQFSGGVIASGFASSGVPSSFPQGDLLVGGNSIDGFVDEVSYWNRFLTDDEGQVIIGANAPWHDDTFTDRMFRLCVLAGYIPTS